MALPISQSNFDDLVGEAERHYEQARRKCEQPTRSLQRTSNFDNRRKVLNEILNPWDQRLNADEIDSLRTHLRTKLDEYICTLEATITMERINAGRLPLVPKSA